MPDYIANNTQMGPPPNQDQLLRMMDDPNFLQQMNEAMENPAVIEMMQNSPMVRNNPMAQEMLRNPEMRRMMFNPEMMRMQMQMQRAMDNNNGGSGFPMPGATNTTPGNENNAQGAAGSTQPPDPFSFFGGGAGAGGANPFASLMGAGGANPFAPPPQNTSGTTGAGADAAPGSTPSGDATSPPPANPFAGLFGAPPTGAAGDQQSNPMAEMTRNLMQNPDALRNAMQMMSAMQGGNGGASPFGGAPFGQPPANATGTASPSPNNPFAALFGPGAFNPPPQDNRPPEEVYESQLRQLNEMGFYDFDGNVAALRRSGGNVQGAIEHLLSGGS